ncbi:MAG TPA: hypothetical protein VM308_04950 [Sphingomicrobium sp.]|nr:hypothetical protein [Sphingomicrobium sp.]
MRMSLSFVPGWALLAAGLRGWAIGIRPLFVSGSAVRIAAVPLQRLRAASSIGRAVNCPAPLAFLSALCQ